MALPRRENRIDSYRWMRGRGTGIMVSSIEGKRKRSRERIH